MGYFGNEHTKFAGESTGCTEKYLLAVAGGSRGYFENCNIKFAGKSTGGAENCIT